MSTETKVVRFRAWGVVMSGKGGRGKLQCAVQGVGGSERQSRKKE